MPGWQRENSMKCRALGAQSQQQDASRRHKAWFGNPKRWGAASQKEGCPTLPIRLGMAVQMDVAIVDKDCAVTGPAGSIAFLQNAQASSVPCFERRHPVCQGPDPGQAAGRMPAQPHPGNSVTGRLQAGGGAVPWCTSTRPSAVPAHHAPRHATTPRPASVDLPQLDRPNLSAGA